MTDEWISVVDIGCWLGILAVMGMLVAVDKLVVEDELVVVGILAVGTLVVAREHRLDDAHLVSWLRD